MENRGFLAGIVLVVGTVAAAGAYFVQLGGGSVEVINKIPRLWDALTTEYVKDSTLESHTKTDILPGTWNIIIFYNDGATDQLPYEVWDGSLTGRSSITGQFMDRDRNQLSIAGFERKGTLALTYAPALATGIGYGTLFLRQAPITGQRAEDNEWVGIAIIHDCKDPNDNGKLITCESQKISICDALLSRKSTPPSNYKAYFSKPCMENVKDLNHLIADFQNRVQ